MASYDDASLKPIPPTLLPGEREHVLIVQDESIFHTNEYRRRVWLAEDQHPIKTKGHGRAIHVSNFICKTIGRLKLSAAEVQVELGLSPAERRLETFEARKITYPGKGHDPWWDLPQLIEQVKSAIAVFEHTHEDKIGVFVFDRSSAHEGYAEDALNVNNMNINPGGKQRKLRDTTIPLCNPDPARGEEDTRGRTQKMCFPEDHSDPKLRGLPKGIRAVLQERKSVWDKYESICKARGVGIVGKCSSCKMSQVKKDAERQIALANAMEKDEEVSAEDIAEAEGEVPLIAPDEWCCMHSVLACQEDFRSERPLIQVIIEDAGHVCLFLPRFHCELNPIEMLWGYAKYRMCIYCFSRSLSRLGYPDYRNSADGKFVNVRDLVPQCLNSCSITTIRRFFQKSWRYMDAYQYVHRCYSRAYVVG